MKTIHRTMQTKFTFFKLLKSLKTLANKGIEKITTSKLMVLKSEAIEALKFGLYNSEILISTASDLSTINFEVVIFSIPLLASV